MPDELRDDEFPGFEPTPEQEREAQQSSIGVFFDSLSDRVDFLVTLHDTGHEDDAFLLACCYIDGIAAWWRGGGASRRKFVDVLDKYGGEPLLEKKNAEILYQHFRNRHVHQLGRFYEEDWGRLLQIHFIDFEILHRALKRIVGAAREESLSKGLLFGRTLRYE